MSLFFFDLGKCCLIFKSNLEHFWFRKTFWNQVRLIEAMGPECTKFDLGFLFQTKQNLYVMENTQMSYCFFHAFHIAWLKNGFCWTNVFGFFGMGFGCKPKTKKSLKNVDCLKMMLNRKMFNVLRCSMS